MAAVLGVVAVLAAVTGATDSHTLTVINTRTITAPSVAGTLDVGGGICWATLSPDGRMVAVAVDTGLVRLVDVSTPSEPAVISDVHAFSGSALAVRFDDDGRRIVSGSDGKAVAVKDISGPRRPRRVGEMRGPAGQICSVAFSADGKRVIAGGANSEIWMWDVTDNSAAPSAVLRFFPGRVYDVHLVGDGFVASGEHGVIQYWPANPAARLDAACRRIGQQITESEWQTYLPGQPYDPPCGSR